MLQFTTESLLEHKNKLLEIPGSKLLFGGQPLEDHSIPQIYGAIKPTAVYVPLEEIVKDKNYELVTKEIFGPFQVWKRRLKNMKNKAVLMPLFLKYNVSLFFCKINNFNFYLQVVTDYTSNQLPIVLDVLEKMHAHLTAAVVSNDPLFLQVRFLSLKFIWVCVMSHLMLVGPLSYLVFLHI